jgi:hypothetical protein
MICKVYGRKAKKGFAVKAQGLDRDDLTSKPFKCLNCAAYLPCNVAFVIKADILGALFVQNFLVMLHLYLYRVAKFGQGIDRLSQKEAFKVETSRKNRIYMHSTLARR